VLIKKHSFSAFTRGFAAAQHTQIPRLQAVLYLIFEFFTIFKVVSYTIKRVEFNGKTIFNKNEF
jgi:hypothetical protein